MKKTIVAGVLIVGRIYYMRKNPPSPEEIKHLIETLNWII